MTLYNPVTGYVLSNWVDNLNYSVGLPTTGTYELVVSGQNAANPSAAYAFEIDKDTFPTTALTLNSEVTGTLVNPGDSASYTFEATPGELVQFNGLEPGSSQYASLVNPSGNQVFGQYLGSNAGPYTLTTPGLYTLVISTNGQNPGAYDFRLLALSSEPKLQVGTTEADLTVTLSSPPSVQVLVVWSTADGSATSGTDYKPASGELLFEPGQTTATIEVQAIDQFTTGSRDFQVVLGGAVGASIVPSSSIGVVTIDASGQGALTGRVFDDLNGSGTLDGNEPGLAGWTVDLLDASNAVIETAQTDSGGAYSFRGLPAGQYTVEDEVPAGYLPSSPPASLSPYSVTLADGQTIGDLNFGNFRAVTISGQVYDDAAGTGTYSPADPGFSGVTIDLLDRDGNVVATTSTDAQGQYAFQGVGAGIDSVRQELPAGAIQTSAARSYALRIASEQDVTGLDFGDFRLVTIEGEVFNDLDGDGSLGAGEPGSPDGRSSSWGAPGASRPPSTRVTTTSGTTSSSLARRWGRWTPRRSCSTPRPATTGTRSASGNSRRTPPGRWTWPPTATTRSTSARTTGATCSSTASSSSTTGASTATATCRGASPSRPGSTASK